MHFKQQPFRLKYGVHRLTFIVPALWGGNKPSHHQYRKFLFSGIDQLVKMANGYVNRISGLHFTGLLFHLHSSPTTLDDVNFFHRIHMANEFFPGGNRSMGKKHKGIKMAGIQNHVSHATPVRSIASGFHFRVFQVASYHPTVLSLSSFCIDHILIDPWGINQSKINHSKRGLLIREAYRVMFTPLERMPLSDEVNTI